VEKLRPEALLRGMWRAHAGWRADHSPRRRTVPQSLRDLQRTNSS